MPTSTDYGPVSPFGVGSFRRFGAAGKQSTVAANISAPDYDLAGTFDPGVRFESAVGISRDSDVEFSVVGVAAEQDLSD